MHKLDKEVGDILKHHGVKGMKWDETKTKPYDPLAKEREKEDKKKGSKKSPKKDSADAKLVNEIIRGKYGNGEVRKKKLGKKYRKLQDLVNEQLLGKSSNKSKDGSKAKSKKEDLNKIKEKLKTKKSGKKKITAKKSDLKNVKQKLKTKHTTRSTTFLQRLKSKTMEEISELLSKFTD